MSPNVSSSDTSMAYSARSRLGFQILLWLLHHSAGEIDKLLPRTAILMISTWVTMKRGRRHSVAKTLAGTQVSLLDDVPGSGSKELCRPEIAARLEDERNAVLFKDGYVVAYPVELSEQWSYRRTISGDAVLRMTGYNTDA